MTSGFLGGAVALARREAVALSAGALCFAWALVGWLAVIPNQDILVDGIQAQSILRDPRIVLAFPGQKHGGPLEYPFTVLAEWLAPGNFYANGAVRPLLAFLTGFLVAKLLVALFPKGARWPFLLAVAVGPTILHGLLGPEGNPVGVWWLQPNWDVAWLLVTGGCLVLAHGLETARESASARRWLIPLVGGLLVGLGMFAHPAIVLLAVPLTALVLMRRPFAPLGTVAGAAGAVMGVVPAAISYVVNAGVNTWDPSHGAFIAVDYYRTAGAAVLGLDGIPDYMAALLPYGLGLPPSQDVLSGALQSALMWVFVLGISLGSVVGVVRAVRARRALTAGAAIACAWLVAIATMFAFITFITPVWIYSSGLGILLWITVGALPGMFADRRVGTALAVAVVGILAVSTVAHNASYLGSLPDRIRAKADVQKQLLETARALQDAGAEIVFGSYYDAVPVGYASSWGMRTITNHYNRFPLSAIEQQQDSYVVAVRQPGADAWSQEAIDLMRRDCRAQRSGDVVPGTDFLIFTCPTAVLVQAR